MKRLAFSLVGIAMAAVIPSKDVLADVHVQVTVPAPAVAVAAPVVAVAPPPLEIQNPEVVVVPSGNAYVYMIPNVYGVYFYNGFWYRFYNGVWYRSTVYNSGWVVVRPALVPRVVVNVYPEYALYLPAGYYRIGWHDFHHHWRDWGHRRHWHHHPWFKREMRADVRRDRIRHIHRERQVWHRDPAKRPVGYHHKTIAPKTGVHKAGPSGAHKVGPGSSGVHKTGPSGVHKTGPSGVHKTGPSGVHKTGPSGVHKAGPSGSGGHGHPHTPPHK